jgi:hypothetical protein
MNYHACLSEKQYSVAVQSLGESVFRKKKRKKIKHIIVLSREINKRNNYKTCQHRKVKSLLALFSTPFWMLTTC